MTDTPIRDNIYNIAERSFWSGINSGLALLTADGFGWLQAEPKFMLLTAATASLISAVKTFSQERLKSLDGHV